MALSLVKREVVQLTPAHAEEALKANSTPGERPLKKSRLQTARNRIMEGMFCRADFAYVDCKQDGKRYRINGHHTSTVLCECADNPDLEFPEAVPLCIEIWQCDRVSELGDAFELFDNPVSNRTSGERLIVHIRERQADLDGVDDKVIAGALKGVNMSRKMARVEEEPSVNQWELGSLLSDPRVVDFCHFVQSFKDASWPGWREAGIAAAMYRSFLDDADTARSTWEECFDELNDNENSSSRKFVNRMRTEKGRKHRTPTWFYNEAKAYWVKSYRKAA